MKKQEFVAYKGDAFAIEWYFDGRGRSQSLEYFENLTEDHQDSIMILFKRMGDSGKIFDVTKFRNEGDKIFAFKSQSDRYLCFFVSGQRIIVTNAFEKKGQKLPQNEKYKALRAMTDYQARTKLGSYYG